MSLIEILIICAIIGILAGISVPLWRNYQPALALDRASQELIVALRQTQQQAITQNKRQAFKFADFVLPEGVIFEEISFPPEEIVKFEPDGSVLKSGYVILRADSKTTKINISIAGHVKKE
ncbi:MAG: hypothetical protein ABIG90_03300 [bacterium]